MRAVAAALLPVLALAACIPEAEGFVEVKIQPGFTVPPLALGAQMLDLKKDSVLLRQRPGKLQLAYERNGQLIPFCDFEVKKNRITSVAVSSTGRNPRCTVQG